MNRLVVATRNSNKAKEIREILKDVDVQIQTLNDFPHIGEIHEEGRTFEENALLKARTVFEQTKLPALADDSGLEVFYLNMRPGVLSARYAGASASDEDNNRKLLEELQGVPDRRRRARYRCVLAFVAEAAQRVVEGSCLGKIAFEPHGSNGFGYDPLFIPTGHNQTFAELASEVKNTVSHRASALHHIRPVFLDYFRR